MTVTALPSQKCSVQECPSLSVGHLYQEVLSKIQSELRENGNMLMGFWAEASPRGEGVSEEVSAVGRG